MVRHVSSIVHIDEEDDVDGGGSTTVVGSTKSLAVGSPEGEALDALPVEYLSRGCLELAFNWAALCLRNVAPMKARYEQAKTWGSLLNLNLTKSYEWK